MGAQHPLGNPILAHCNASATNGYSAAIGGFVTDKLIVGVGGVLAMPFEIFKRGAPIFGEDQILPFRGEVFPFARIETQCPPKTRAHEFMFGVFKIPEPESVTGA